ncbi:MAG: hypothetical protein FWH36_01165 [Lentimicrobiaceae bacterium]|nr:hypothetical protein [Lentimicrobiaceae bacterium]
MKSTKYIVIQVALLAGIVLFVLLIYRSIVRPEKFNNVYEARKKDVVAKLEQIRSLQAFYKAENGFYAKDFDALKDFFNNGKVTVVLKEGNVPDTLTEEQAVKLKIVRRDTLLVDAKEEIGKALPGMDISRINVVPYSKGESFELKADTIPKGSIVVHVYQVTAYKHQYLKDLDNDVRVKEAFMGGFLFSGMQKQFLGPHFSYRDNVKDLILGSLDEASTDGNWQ